jgi:AraC-like DNA-binding protein
VVRAEQPRGRLSGAAAEVTGTRGALSRRAAHPRRFHVSFPARAARAHVKKRCASSPGSRLRYTIGSMPPTIAAICAERLVQCAAAAGMDLQGLPWGPLPSPNRLEARIPYDCLLQLWESVMRTSRDPGFPITVGGSATAHDYDAVGFVCLTQPTLREAIHQCVRYSRVWTDISRWRVESTERTVSLFFACPDPHRLGVRCATESVLAEMLNAGRVLLGRDYAATRVRFRHAAPGDTAAHERFFRGPIEWGADENELAIPADVADLPLPKADAALAAFFERHIRQILDRLAEEPGPERVTQRVRAFLLEEVRRGVPTLPAAAARLGMSPRTLKRRLQEEGASFQDVLDGVRCELAKHYLEEQRLAVGEVSFLLGFSEPSAFHRAFKRWTGRTPLAYRQAPSLA